MSNTTKDGWFIHPPGKNNTSGPFDTKAMEDHAHNGVILPNSRISHQRYTKGKIVEARRIARFFNIFASVSEETTLTVSEQSAKPTALSSIAKREEDVAGIGRFMADGQDPAMICKLTERVDGICTAEEHALYMAVQQRPIANFSPDAVVLTNRRAIIFRQKVLGRLQFVDVNWLNVSDVHLTEDILGSTISVRGLNGHTEELSYLPKDQARKIYRIAQDMEEKMVELRRERSMEEKRAIATNVTVNNDLGNLPQPPPPPPSNAADDPAEVLKTLKSMLDAGLIEQEEYNAKKTEILSRM